jgi:2-oxoglutarate/2-oxoacid ferredoxin oxidoreductase subunit beta
LSFDRGLPIQWCPGCGNYGALNNLQEVLEELNFQPNEVVVVSGIGQAGKFTHFIRAHTFNGLHGRYLSNAAAIKLANPKLKVFAISGDGCTYSEGGNHFLHTIRYNPDIVNIIHNNQVYGLTKGQASPTSQIGFITKVQNRGVYNTPFDGAAIAVSMDASFVARAFVGDKEQTKKILEQAIQHKGYAMIDLLCPCVSFNKINTYAWYKKNSYYLDEDYDPYDREAALKIVTQNLPFPLGVIYKSQKKPTFEENVGIYENDPSPMFMRKFDSEKFENLLKKFQ